MTQDLAHHARSWRAPMVASALSLVVTLVYHHQITTATGGSVSYPVDDAFIHLAIAKTIAFSHTYGVVPGAFTSASSSIVWPPLLAIGMAVLGDHAWLPLYLNVAFGALVPFALGRLIRTLSPKLPAPLLFGALLGALFLGPLPTLITLGMEHTLHALITIVFVGAWLRAPRGSITLAALGLLAVTVRYESLFLVALVALHLLVRQRSYRNAAWLSAFGVAPVLSFGLFLHAHDHPFMPLSVVMKGVHPRTLPELLEALTMLPFAKLRDNWTTLAVVLGGCAAAFASQQESQTRKVLFLLVGTAAMQTLLGNLGWFYRYDAYLVLPMTAISLVAFSEVFVQKAPALTARMAAWAALSALVLGAPRGLYAARHTVTAATNIYEQQVHSARFLATFFPNGTVLVNDIGAVAYYRRAPLIDLMGLANKDVAAAREFRIDRPLSTQAIASLARGTDVAIVYDAWFEGVLPTTWTRMARWTITNNRVCAFPSVSVYATHPESVQLVQEAVSRMQAGRTPGPLDSAR